MPHPISVSRMLCLVPAALYLAACKADMGSSHPLSLSVTTKSAATVSQPAAAGVRADIVITSGSNTLTITSAKIVLSEIELSPGGPCSTTGEDDNCDELEVGPDTVNLPVDGSTQAFLDAVVPPGTYTGLDAELKTVIVQGTFQAGSNAAVAFADTVPIDAQIEASFQTPVTFDATSQNVTINVDVASWFKDATGAVIDPTNAANLDAIRHNIQQSFHAFEDDNHDGEDDSQEHSGTGGDN